jgi:cell division protein FtsB
VRSVRETSEVVEQLKARRAELEEQNRALAREVEALRRDAAARERSARELLGVASPDEIVVLLPPPTPSPTPPPPSPPSRTAGKGTPDGGVL